MCLMIILKVTRNQGFTLTDLPPPSKTVLGLTVKNLMNADFYHGRLKNWLTRTWLPYIKRWCLAYRPDDLMLCNANNGTERLNEDLKHGELHGYKNCSLS